MGRYLIQTPVRDATFDLGSVHFHNGRVELDEVPHWLRNYADSAGYSITDQRPAAEAQDADDDGNPLTPPPATAKVDVWREHVLALKPAAEVDGLTKDQLKELAAELAKESEQQ
jgi:hypothetical protein